MGDAVLEEPLILDTPTIVSGAVLRGFCRDALVRVRSAATIEDVVIERVARPDGSPSWGSCIVVESQGDLIVRRCRIVGAAHGHVVDKQMRLGEGESWTHAGIDVRGTGHARVEDCVIEDCPGYGASASIFPADERDNLVVERSESRRCGIGVHVTAAAVARLDGLGIDGCAEAVRVAGGRVRAKRVRATNCGAAFVANGGDSEFRNCQCGDVTGSAIWAERDARVTAIEVVGGTCGGPAVAARGRSIVAVQQATFAACTGNGIEVVGASDLQAKRLTLSDVKGAAILAADAGRARFDSCTLSGTPSWALFADAVAEVAFTDTSLPSGPIELRGAARVEGHSVESWDLDRWTAELRARGPGIDFDSRKAVGERIESAVKRLALDAEAFASLRALLPHWSETGCIPHAPRLEILGRMALGAAVVDLCAFDGGCVALLADGSLLRVGSDGQIVWRSRLRHVGQSAVVVGNLVGALSRVGPWDESLAVYRLENGADLGTVAIPGGTFALRLGDTITVGFDELTGHPTDRCARTIEWTPGSQPKPAAVIGSAGERTAGEWNWFAGRLTWPGGAATRAREVCVVDGEDAPRTANAITGRDKFVLVATDRLRLYEGRTLLAVLGESGVAALSTADVVWAGTRAGDLLRLAIH